MAVEAHDARDWPAPGVRNRPVIAIAAGLMAMMLISVAALTGVYIWKLPERDAATPLPLPAPQVRTDETLLRRQLERDQLSRLSGYAWQNPEKTLIRIPIERAMQILAARGPQAYDPIIAPPKTAGSPGHEAAAANQTPGSRVPSGKEPTGAELGQGQP